MNILFTSTVFPHARDRTRGTYNRELAAALAAEHDVRVVAPVAWREAIKTLDRRTDDDPPGVPVARPAYWYLPKVRPQSLGRRLFAANRRGLRQIAAGWKPDLVVSYWLYPDAWAGQEVADALGARHATIVGGSDVLKLPHEPKRGPLVRDVLARCDTALAVSQQLVDAIHQVDPSTHAVNWSQGIRTETLHPGDAAEARQRLGWPVDVPTFLWVGRMVGVKALPRLIEAFAALQRTTPSRLVLVGGGPSQAGAVEAAAAAGVSDRVHFAGPIAPAALGDWYRACDAVVLSSDSEGLPNVLREGLACGRPFASSHVGGIGEIGEDDCRVLARPGDVASLTDAMQTVLAGRFRQAAEARPVRTWATAASDLLAAVESSPTAAPPASVSVAN